MTDHGKPSKASKVPGLHFREMAQLFMHCSCAAEELKNETPILGTDEHCQHTLTFHLTSVLALVLHCEHL